MPSIRIARHIVRLAALAMLTGNVTAHNWDGQLDSSFGAESGFGQRSGKAVHAWPEPQIQLLESDALNFLRHGQVALQPDGRLIIGMPLRVNAILWHFGVLRLHPDGTLDTSFGNGGARRLAFQGSDFSHLWSLAIRPGGEILLAGSVTPPQMNSRMAVAQLTANGDLDPSFGVAGWATAPFGLPDETGTAIALQADGKVLLAGNAANNASFTGSMTLVRLLGNGQFDQAFGNNGRMSVSLVPQHTNAGALGLRLLDDERILLAGLGSSLLQGTSLSTSMALARVMPNGALDTSFGTSGIALHNIGPAGQANTLDLLTGVDVQDDGRILACGFSGTLVPIIGSIACVRFFPHGPVDPDHGPALINFPLGYPFSQAAHVRIDPQGRALVAGSALRSDDNADFGLARLLPDGSLDPTFGVGGRVTHDRCARGTCLATNPNNQELNNPLFGLALQPDGRIVMAGLALQPDGTYRLLVTRVHGDRLFASDLEAPP